MFPGGSLDVLEGGEGAAPSLRLVGGHHGAATRHHGAAVDAAAPCYHKTVAGAGAVAPLHNGAGFEVFQIIVGRKCRKEEF